MLGINEMNQELVRAFNINLCYNDIAITNLTVQNLDGKDHIVISFDKNMDSKQCVKYLNNMKEKIIKRSYRDEKVAGVSYNLKFFPFAFNTKHLPRDDKGRKKFSVEIDEGVVFNLKCYLAKALVGDVKERMGREFGVERIKKSIYDTSFDRNSYLYCMLFHDKGIQKYFIDLFSSKIARYEENAPRDYLEIIGNCVYIKKSIFDNIEFIKDIEAHNASLICRDFQTPSSKDKGVEDLKFPIISFIRKTGIPVHSVIRTSYEGSNEDSVFIPIVAQNGKVNRLLNDNDAYRISSAFNMEILSDVSESISVRLPKSDSSDGIIYGIDFADVDIACCVLNKIIESSVINKDHELAIDPELYLQALSPAQSPFNSPTHAEPSGLRTPPNPRKGNRDSGIGESPPKPKDSVAHSSRGGPRSLFEQPQTQRFPTRDQNVVLKDSPRRESEKFPVLLLPPLGTRGVPGTSKEFSPSPQLNSSAWSQPIGFWSSPAPSAGLWSLLQSGPSSWKGANPVGANPWSQPYCSSPAPNAGLWSLSQSGPSSWQGASASDKPLTEEEKELFKALLYTLNLTNYTFDGVYTNFFTKDGKIVSLLHDNVNREKYLQEVKASIIEKCCETEEEARKVYDLDEFPFKLNYEEKQGKTVVANISSGALSNLKILFSQKFGKNVYAIDISVVKEVEKHEKEKWVGYQLEGCTFTTEEDIKEDVKLAYTSCFPDEGAMKIIPIAFDEEEGEYVLDRSRDRSEVRLLRKALPPLTTKEEVQRFLDCVFKTGKTQQELSQEEKELFKALLYAFNYSNNNFDRPDTNFIVKNGKIVSLINDDVDVKEYLKEVRGETIKEYCVNEKEAYDLNEFPFKFLSNCEKNQETTVVANISRGALFNLEKLFIYGYEEKVKIEKIDINIVKEAVKSKKHRLVELKEKGIEREAGYHTRIKHCEAATASYPDESALEDIPIGKYEAGYRFCRTFNDWETESASEELRCAEGTSKAEKMKSEDNKDSGYSSGFVTDAENVSSKADAITSSGYESMDCENTREGSPKRTLELSMGMEELAISTELDATKTEQLCSPIKKPRSN